MKPKWSALLFGVGLVLPVGGIAWAQAVVQAPFDQDYTLHDLGQVPGLPPKYGGLTFLLGDPEFLIIGGVANQDQDQGRLYSVGVVRDADRHVIGFAGEAVFFADAAYNDGGVAYGPAGVLFLARWPVNELGQVKPGSSTTDKVIGLSPFQIASSPGGLGFVPEGYPGAGSLKMVSWPGGQFYTAGLQPDGAGTFDLTEARFETQLPGGPEGFVYVPPGSPQFSDGQFMLVSEYSANAIGAYRLDGAGIPIPASRQTFLTGLNGAEGAALDPLTGDYLFSTFGGGDKVVVVRGLAPAPAADLGLTKTVSANELSVGQEITYTLALTNRGPHAATEVTVTDSLPPGVNVVSIAPSQGICQRQGDLVTCQLGTVAKNAGATIALVVVPLQAGTLTNTASVRAVEPDPVAANDTATAISMVAPGGATLGIDMYAGLTIAGEVGRTYRVESKDELTPGASWVALTNLVLTQTPYLWIDVSSASVPRRVYRAVDIGP